MTSAGLAVVPGRGEPASGGGEMPRFSPLLQRWFAFYLEGYFARNFNAVRASLAGAAPEPGQRPLVVYTNHPSWWDPIHFFLLAHLQMPGHRIYGPFDAEALKKYGFFRRLGAFGVERGTRRGTTAFIRTSLSVLQLPDAGLWLTAEGGFTDPRQRPVRIRPGLAHLLRRLDGAWVVPLAIEYPFWNERRPEALSRFGTPMFVTREPRRSVAEWTERLETALEQTLDALAGESRERDPARFKTLVLGRAGVGGIYDRWRRLSALLRGRRFDPAHEVRRR